MGAFLEMLEGHKEDGREKGPARRAETVMADNNKTATPIRAAGVGASGCGGGDPERRGFHV